MQMRLGNSRKDHGPHPWQQTDLHPLVQRQPRFFSYVETRDILMDDADRPPNSCPYLLLVLLARAKIGLLAAL